MQNKKSFRHESLQDRKTIRKLLDAITDGLQQGRLSFSSEDGTIQMEPKELLHLKISAVKDGGNNRVSLRISWHDESEQELRNKKITINKRGR
ncbi:MAG: amphi-Trp domain-containing protein [Mariprofundales bacterium]|nr:amphi-Trp domain-containing protein [Mariprofundales bacterium]